MKVVSIVNTLILALFFMLSLAGVALAQEEVAKCEGILCQVLQNFPELNAWLIAIFTAIGLTLRGVAELLGFLGAQLKNKAASEWGQKLGSWSLWAAQAVGWFGGGTPRAVMLKKLASELEKTKPGASADDAAGKPAA